MKLTNAIRRSIISKAISDAFDKQEESIKKEENKLALKIYNDVFTKKERDYMESAPNSDMFYKKNSFKISYCGDQRYFHLKEKMRFPYEQANNSWNPIKVYGASDKIGEQIHILSELERKNEENKRDFVVKLNQLLESVNTDKQLLERWPEGKKYFNVKEKRYDLVPDSLIKDINSIIKSGATN